MTHVYSKTVYNKNLDKIAQNLFVCLVLKMRGISENLKNSKIIEANSTKEMDKESFEEIVRFMFREKMITVISLQKNMISIKS